ncbi:6-hydroxymethylpterin diphosphokinase MptE-like protein [uncultured Brachyspira sp.]|uniref:motility associated factor glycosyltransferase family protein n=1 Tax=uncultured Brachyspira sp. TaxID=221953 RepID=UPI0026298D49|nr:6-hydroxymethylpterin diphosphokinase MptE-like protein [uncultured Brachyspira sp.]
MNNNIFNNNLKELQKNKYNFRAVNKLKDYKSNNEKYKIKLTKNNLISILFNNKPLTSTYAPIEEAKKLIEQFIKDNNTHIGIFLSIASFYHIEYFLSLNKNNKAIIIEKDIEIVKLILENIESKYLCNVIIILNEDIETTLAFFNFYMNDTDTKKIVYIRHVRASTIDKETSDYYDRINIYLANSIKEKLMSLTSNYYFAPIWSRNILYNMHFNSGYSIKTYHNILKKEVPLLLISAGASIDNHIEEIKELSKNHFTIVLSHAFNTLINNNIKPDAVVSTDGGFYSSIHIMNLIKKQNRDIKIFTTHSAYPFPLTDIEDERIFYFSHDESLEKILYNIDDSDDNNNIYFCMEGSVIMPALRIAYMLNPKYILLAGCDFCHIDDKSHSLYSNAIALDLINSNKLKTFETLKYKRLNDNQKQECYDNVFRSTSSSLMSYKNHFESLVQEIINTVEIFTLTKESAKINNVKIYNFDYKVYDKNNIKIENYIKENVNKNELIKKIENFIDNVKKGSINNIEEIKELGNMISPWHIDEMEKSRMEYSDFRKYILNWHNDIKKLLY